MFLTVQLLKFYSDVAILFALGVDNLLSEIYILLYV